MRLLPKSQDFFTELDRHASLIVTASHLLLEISQGGGDLSECAAQIKRMESECDAITHEVILKLHRTFITPLDRLDTHDIASRLDDVMDALEQAAYCLARYQHNGQVPPEVVELVGLVATSIEQLERGVGMLKQLKQGE